MSVFRTTIEITRSSSRVLNNHRRLMLFPLLATMTGLTVLVVFLPIIVHGSSTEAGFALAGLYLALELVSVFYNAALSCESLRALRGQSTSVAGGLGSAAARWKAVAGFSLISSTVGVALGALDHARQRGLIRFMLGTAWLFVSYLAVPVMMAERRGGYDSLRRSGRLLRQTWGETALGEIGVRVITIPVVLTILILGALLSDLIDHPIALVLAICLLMAFVIAFGTLQAIYRCALYIYAAEGVIPDDFDTPEMHDIWRAK